MIAELLAPAGNLLGLKTAINAGADAVYIGGKMFGARAYADNASTEELIEGIEYAHLRGKKIYLTVNTLMKDKEIENELYNYILPLYYAGLDAVIVQDFGVLKYIKEHFEKLQIHASTQMTITGPEEARLLENLGASRIVTPRELSLEEIKNIKKNINIEIESFIHGALCYCYSGQCLFSSIIGGRSGNRGKCAQPCRLPYELNINNKVVNNGEKYILSPKDMNTITILPEIIEAGVFSLKIEGRMKKPEYVACVVSIYRKYLDLYIKNGKTNYKVEKEDLDKLYNIFNRNGFNKSYYKEYNGRDMITLKESQFRTKDEEYIKYLDENYVNCKNYININGTLIISKEMPVRLEVKYKDIIVNKEEGIITEAKNQPATAKDVEERIRKTGNTQFKFENLKIDIEDGLFVPNSVLNEIKRHALDELYFRILQSTRRKEMDLDTCVVEQKKLNSYKKENIIPQISVSVNSFKQLKALENYSNINNIYIESTLFKDSTVIEYCNKKLENKNIFILMPGIFRTKQKKAFLDIYKNLNAFSFKGFVVKTIEEYLFLKNELYINNKNIIFDYNIYTFNKQTKEVYKDMCAELNHIVAPIELNNRELKTLNISNMELLVYGKIPMMISAGCVKKTMNMCNGKEEFVTLKDRYNTIFKVETKCDYCYNIIYNSKPLSLLDCYDDVNLLSPLYIRLSFTDENESQVQEICKKFINKYIYKKEENELKEFTRGHFKRGV